MAVSASAATRARLPKETFTFGVPLIARACATSWSRISDLLELTLRSVLAQTDGDFRLLLAGHDEPESWKDLTRGDSRFRFLQAGWRPEAPTSRNDDGGRKKWLIKDHVRQSCGGLLMYLDADDLLDRRLVELARAMIPRDHVGAVVGQGVLIDFATLRAVRLPHARVFDGDFYRLCGSSTIGRVEPTSRDPLRRDPHGGLGSHHQWPEAAQRSGVALTKLPLWGAYFVNTSENHSELHGPFARWRRTLNEAVAVEGAPVDRELASRFGLDLDLLVARSGIHAPPASPAAPERRRTAPRARAVL